MSLAALPAPAPAPPTSPPPPTVPAPVFRTVAYEPARDPASEPFPHVPAPRRPRRIETAGVPALTVSVRPDPRERERARVRAATRRAELVVRLVLEILTRRRPLAHLVPLAAPEVLRYVAAGIPGPGRPVTGAGLHSLRVSMPTRTSTEITAVYRAGDRFKVLAAWLEPTPTGDWRCVGLRIL